MSADERLPADMLLLRERRRRMASSSTPVGPVVASGTTAEPVLLESDAIVDGFASEEPPARDSALHLYRPLGSVTLAAMTWTGAIDHAALQRAIACAPLEGPVQAFSSGWYSRMSMANAPQKGEAALHAALSTSDVELLEHASSNHAAPVVEKLALASLLPSTIVGADDPTIDAATAVLTIYRRASLVVAWLDAIGGDAGGDATSRRDEAAAAAMSMLRALLGEA